MCVEIKNSYNFKFSVGDVVKLLDHKELYQKHCPFLNKEGIVLESSYVPRVDFDGTILILSEDEIELA